MSASRPRRLFGWTVRTVALLSIAAGVAYADGNPIASEDPATPSATQACEQASTAPVDAVNLGHVEVRTGFPPPAGLAAPPIGGSLPLPDVQQSATIVPGSLIEAQRRAAFRILQPSWLPSISYQLAGAHTVTSEMVTLVYRDASMTGTSGILRQFIIQQQLRGPIWRMFVPGVLTQGEVANKPAAFWQTAPVMVGQAPDADQAPAAPQSLHVMWEEGDIVVMIEATGGICPGDLLAVAESIRSA